MTMVSVEVGRAERGRPAGAPFAGFKWIVGPGFTGFVQLGVSFIAIHAEASDDTGSSASADESTAGLLLNFNLGWSF